MGPIILLAVACKLYVIPGSHPSACAEAALRLKGIAYERVDLLPLMHKAHQRVVVGGTTVPGLRIDGEKLSGSRAILRRLDELVADPPLFPSNAEARALVEEAEAWGDETLQPAVRRIVWALLRRSPRSMMSYAENAKLPIPVSVAALSTWTVARLETIVQGANDDAVRADLAALPGWLDRIDGWIADGVLDGGTANAADLQIGSSLRLALTLADVAPLVEDRPAGDLARRHFPRFAGHVPAGTAPPGWVPTLAAA
jgi:glutathione S-transferase